MTFDEFKSSYTTVFKKDLKKRLDALEPAQKPKDELIPQIVENSTVLIQDDILKKVHEELEKQVTAQNWFEDIGDDIGDLLTDIDPTHPQNQKAVCIAGSMVAAAALLAAWVASGGTLTVGIMAAGVQITTPIYAALVGGGGAAAVAAAMC